MSTETKFRRGTTNEHSSFTGAVAEVTVDTDKQIVVVHDGSTAGGFPVLSAHNPILDPEHATDGGTDAFASATNTSTPGDGETIVRDFQSANTTTTPTLDGKTMTTKDGSALWPGAVSGVHELQRDEGADTYLVLEPLPTEQRDLAKLPALEGVVDATNGGADDLTAIDFTGIKSGARRITIMFDAVSLSGTDDALIQIGDSGGLETSSYENVSANGAGDDVSSGSGFIIKFGNAGGTFNGHIVLTLIDPSTNTWVQSHVLGRGGGDISVGGGNKSLSAELDRVRVTRTSTATFDGGNINILVE